MFCKHEWELICETTIDSPMERLEGQLSYAENIQEKFFMSTNIQAFQCKKCGKFKRFVTEV